MSDFPRDPELENLFELFGEGLKAQLRVGLPGKLTAYDADKQRASVKVLVRDSHVDPKQKRVATSVPEIHGVPVMQLGPPRGRMTFPIAVGDLCWVMFASSSITQWVMKGGEVDPKNDRHLDINDAVALVGLHSFASIPTTAPTDAVVIHCGLGIKAKIGGPIGTQPTIMGTTYRGAEDTLLTALSVVMAAISTFAANCVGPTAPQLTALQGAITTFTTAITAFTTGAAGYLTQNAEVK